MKEHQNLHRLTYRHLPEWNPETLVAQSGAFARSKVLEFEVNLHHVREHDGERHAETTRQTRATHPPCNHIAQGTLLDLLDDVKEPLSCSKAQKKSESFG